MRRRALAKTGAFIVQVVAAVQGRPGPNGVEVGKVIDAEEGTSSVMVIQVREAFPRPCLAENAPGFRRSMASQSSLSKASVSGSAKKARPYWSS